MKEIWMSTMAELTGQFEARLVLFRTQSNNYFAKTSPPDSFKDC